MAKTKLNMASGLAWLEKAINLYKEYGLFGIIKGLFILIILSITIRICYNPGFLYDSYTEYMIEKHERDLQTRAKLDKRIKSLLPIYLDKYKSDRVWIIQYHNGIMDWLHGTMRFELCKLGIHSVSNQYDNFNLTWLNMPYYLADKEIFIGDLEKLGSVDPALYLQFVKNGTKYLACIVIRGDNGYPIGVLGTTWNKIPVDTTLDMINIHNKLIDDRATIKALIQMR